MQTEGKYYDQGATAVDEKVRELQERVEALMVVIVRKVTDDSEEVEMVAAGKEIEVDLKDLLEYVGYTCRRAYSG